jgi:catechol 2,3-dioxygenase-like lactoylglutathione lyase family enzyme
MTTTQETPGTPDAIAGLDRIAQIKLPVTDLVRSAAFYRELLGLRLFSEFVEDGVLRGAGLIDPQGRFCIALRDRTVCAGTPSLDGFDVVAFTPPSRAVLDDIITRCERHGIKHAEPYDTPAGTILDVPDPDGTVVRFYHFTAGTDGFTGVESRDGAIVGSYQEPRLPAA